MNIEQYEEIIKSLARFVTRVAEDEKATPAEIAALPEVARVLFEGSRGRWAA